MILLWWFARSLAHSLTQSINQAINLPIKQSKSIRVLVQELYESLEIQLGVDTADLVTVVPKALPESLSVLACVVLLPPPREDQGWLIVEDSTSTMRPRNGWGCIGKGVEGRRREGGSGGGEGRTGGKGSDVVHIIGWVSHKFTHHQNFL